MGRTSEAEPAGPGERDSSTVSAQGTRLNKRGIQSRGRILDAAIETLAEEGPAAASVNSIAKRAGFTWGTVQHQFGDADGLWAALIDEMRERLARVDVGAPPRRHASLRHRVTTLVQLLWQDSASNEARSVASLRLALPRDTEVLARTFPRTEAAFRRFDETWDALWRHLFTDLPVSTTRLGRVRSLVPAAIGGLRTEADVITDADPEEGVHALIEGVVAYLESDAT
jgi:AcrR family transcriptional regulator